MTPRLASIMATPGIIALAVTKFKTGTEGEAEMTLTARAPLNTAFHGDGTPCETTFNGSRV